MNGSLEIIFDWYKKKTDKLLYQAQLTPIQGTATPPFVNIANMENTGIDVMVTKRGSFLNKKFRYDAALTFTTYNNKITGLQENVDYFGSGGSRIGDFARNQIGQSVSAFYGYKVIGIFQDSGEVSKAPTQKDAAAGRYRYLDANNDGKISDSDRVFFGNPNPDFTYGLNLNLGYGAFDLSAFFYGVAGKDVINYTNWWTDYYSSFQGGKSKRALYDSWSPTNRNAKLPIVENSSNFSNQQVPNSSLMENGSYLRLKSLILGYTVPKTTLSRVGIDRIRVYVQGANLFTVTKYTGLDPEFIGGDTAFGIDYGNYRNQKQFLVGLNVTF